MRERKFEKLPSISRSLFSLSHCDAASDPPPQPTRHHPQIAFYAPTFGNYFLECIFLLCADISKNLDTQAATFWMNSAAYQSTRFYNAMPNSIQLCFDFYLYANVQI